MEIERVKRIPVLMAATCAFAAVAETVTVGAGWCIVPEGNAPEVRYAAESLSSFFRDTLKCPLPVREAAGASPCIRLCLAETGNRLRSRVTVSRTGVCVEGATPREVVQGGFRLQEMLAAAGAPSLEVGERTFTRMFSPRMTHSSVGIDAFPDAELDAIAQAGMDAVLVYVGKAPDVTRGGRIDMNDLVARAARRGLDVYVYAFDAKGATQCDPVAPDAVEQYDRLYGAILANAPGVKGIVFVGESCAFPSKLPGMGGFYWAREKDRHTFGFWPSLDWVDWLNAVKTALRRHRPDAEVVFWTYNWFNAPEPERVALLEKIPSDVTTLVTFDMGSAFERYKGVPIQIDDYSISRPGPSRVFTSEAEVIARRGIRLLSMANSGGRTWDFGCVPCIPAPYLWFDRYRALGEARRRYGLSGLMDSHHFGWSPGFVSDLAKACFTEENAGRNCDDMLAEIASRRFGAEAVPTVLAAWKDWSEAMRLHSANAFDQYGPLRVGPSYPLTRPGETRPAKPKGKWLFLWPSYFVPEWRIAPLQELAARELALWRRGNDRIAAAVASLPSARRDAVTRLLGVGRLCAASVRTMINARDYYRHALKLQDAKSDVTVRATAAAAMRKVLDDEAENVKAALPVVEADPTLGREPVMGVVVDRLHLEWKLRQLDDQRRFLDGPALPKSASR